MNEGGGIQILKTPRVKVIPLSVPGVGMLGD